VPLGGAQKERGVAASAASEAIRAFLRPAAPEPAVELPVAVPAAVQPATPPTAVREPAPRREPKQEPRPSVERAPASPTAAPAIFYDPSQLTQPPRPLSEPPLELLHSVLARAGTVQLVLYIDEAGNVASVDVDSATLPPAAAQRAAAIFATVRFSPGTIDGTAVKTRVRITVGAEERKKEN
jgi:hypothetical protein